MEIKKYFRIKFFREISNFKFLFSRDMRLLNLDNKVAISKKKSFISFDKLNEINELLVEKNQINKDSMWHSISNKFHLNFLNLVKNDIEKLKYALNNPHNFNIFYGFDDNCKILHNTPNFNFRFRYSKPIIDKLLSFCEYLGILRLDNPEYLKKKYNNLNIENLIRQIEKKITIKLNFINPFPGEKGIKTSRGILSLRELEAIYQAYRIKKLIDVSKNIKNILEIGGGLGRTAYYCYRFGIKNYTLVDLLVPRICQINYLSRLLNDKNIISKPKKINFNQKNIKLISPEYLFSKNIKFDFVFNSDSFSEVDYFNQKRYTKYILKNSKIFFSINHEYNKYKVTNFFKIKNVNNYSKNLYWLRKGYVEEIFNL